MVCVAHPWKAFLIRICAVDQKGTGVTRFGLPGNKKKDAAPISPDSKFTLWIGTECRLRLVQGLVTDWVPDLNVDDIRAENEY
jgi:hypothetical protein